MQKVQSRTSIVAAALVHPRNVVYRIVELVDGEETVRYTNVEPKSGVYEVVSARRAVEP